MSDFSTAVATVGNLLDVRFSNASEAVDQLSMYLNDLIQNDFNAVVTILYRMDVSEQKVREKLANPKPGENADAMLAILLIERELEKMEWRKRYREGRI